MQTNALGSANIKMAYESQFLKNYEILKWDELTVLNNDRKSIDIKIDNKMITEPELLSQFKVELSLLHACKLKVQELENVLNIIDTQILFILCKRIITLFHQMHILFSSNKEVLSVCINVCRENVAYINAEQVDVLLNAVLSIGDNEHIWIQLLQLHLELKNFDNLLNIFRKGVGSLKENSLPLFKMLIKRLGNRRPDMVKTVLEEGSNISYENISLKMRPKYLKWCMEFEGIDVTRNIFNELKNLQPPCCKLYLKMIAIESERSDFELDTVRKLYDEVCDLFGRNNLEVWLDYTSFERTKGSMSLKRRVCNKAIFRLENNLRDPFVIKYQDMEREYRNNRLGDAVIVIDD